MKIAIATVQVPFVTGGAEILVNMLKQELQARGHQAEIVTVPFKWYPPETLLQNMLVCRMIDLAEMNGEKIDLLIATKFPAYYFKHPRKVLWLMHQHRQAYDLWETKYSDLPHYPDGEFFRQTIIENDNLYLQEARKIFTIAQNTSKRLKKFNNLDSTTLYHPPHNYERLHCETYGDFIFYPSRINELKRQRLLVEAAKYISSDTKIKIAGGGDEKEIAYLKEQIRKHKLQSKVELLGYISEEEKIKLYATCLAVYFGTYDEDYGYITLETFFAHKPIFVHPDAGGPLEFVENDVNGYILETNAKLVAQKIDELAFHKSKAEMLGQNGYQSMLKKNMSWDYVIQNLLS